MRLCKHGKSELLKYIHLLIRSVVKTLKTLSHVIESRATYTNVVCIDVIILSFVQLNTWVVICKQKQSVNIFFFSSIHRRRKHNKSPTGEQFLDELQILRTVIRRNVQLLIREFLFGDWDSRFCSYRVKYLCICFLAGFRVSLLLPWTCLAFFCTIPAKRFECKSVNKLIISLIF